MESEVDYLSYAIGTLPGACLIPSLVPLPEFPVHAIMCEQMVPAGQYEEVQEGDFLEAVTKTERVVCHFFHREFERCRFVLGS